MCLSETYLNHDTLFEGNNLRIPVYESIMVEHEKVNFLECKWETVYFYLDLLFTKSIIRRVHKFLSNFELLLANIANQILLVSIIVGNFNARSKNWCSNDKRTYEGKKNESFTCQYGLK